MLYRCYKWSRSYNCGHRLILVAWLKWHLGDSWLYTLNVYRMYIAWTVVYKYWLNSTSTLKVLHCIGQYLMYTTILIYIAKDSLKCMYTLDYRKNLLFEELLVGILFWYILNECHITYWTIIKRNTQYTEYIIIDNVISRD